MLVTRRAGCPGASLGTSCSPGAEASPPGGGRGGGAQVEDAGGRAVGRRLGWMEEASSCAGWSLEESPSADPGAGGDHPCLAAGNGSRQHQTVFIF